MEDDFKKAWGEYFESTKHRLTDAQVAAYGKFALSNRTRAGEFISSIQTDLGFSFGGKRVLDIGSAYGGFVICAAQLGAAAYGIEILPHLHELALANAQNENGFHKLINGDVLDRDILIGTDNKPFDLIIVNDVFEHIYDSFSLFNRLKELSHENSIVYFAIPNGDSWRSILNEGHKFQFGLSLLEPGAWPEELGAFNIYYRPIEYYQLHFEYAGFPHLYIKVDKNTLRSSYELVIDKFAELEQAILSQPFSSKFQNDHALHRFNLLKQKLEHFRRLEDTLKMHINYDQHFWIGYAVSEVIPELENNTSLVRISLDHGCLGEKKPSKISSIIDSILNRRPHIRGHAKRDS